MSRIALIGENSLGYVNALLDIWNNGNCAVLIDWRIPSQTMIDLMNEAEVHKCYIEKYLFEKIKLALPTTIDFIFYEKINSSAMVLPKYISCKFQENYSKNEAIIIYSSGTTGKVKGIILSHFDINTNADAIIDYMKPTTENCIYIAKTLSHSSTLTGELLVALKTKMNIVIAPTIVPPRYVFMNIKKFNVTFICLNPTLLSMLADELAKKQYDISTLIAVYVSGCILNDKIYNKAHMVFSNIPIYNVYGLSEAGPRVTAQRIDCCKSNSVGKPISGIEIAIVNENGNLVSDGKRGVIHVNTPSLFSNYVTGDVKHISLYRGWLNTGDVGYKDKFGELHIVGRIDDIIICDAHKVYPSDIENLIMQDNAITDCAVSRCVCNGLEIIGCLYVSHTDCTFNIVHRLKNILMQYEIPKKFLMVKSIPYNDRGKIDRKKVSDILSEGNLKGE